MVLASEESVVVGVLERPKAWPSFKLQASELASVLAKFGNGKCFLNS